MNKYILSVYNTITGNFEDVEVSKEIYEEYKRIGWRIEKSDAKHKKNEIPLSSLKGGENGNYEMFREFIDHENTPDQLIAQILQLEALQDTILRLCKSDRALIQAIYFDGLSERDYAKKSECIPMRFIIGKRKF